MAIDPAHYVTETWTEEEVAVLRRYFTNLEGPVFALVNLPEVVKGALFARYSRSAKSLRRLFLDEFVGDLDVSGDHSVDATVGLARAEQLYDKVFFEYGDDSVAQLGGVHLACEQVSNLLTKAIEWSRMMSFMEKSTRYVAYDARLGNGRYRYHRDPEVLDSALGARFVGDLDRLFDAYAGLLPAVQAYLAAEHPKAPGDSDLVWRQSVRAKAYDTVRGLLPAAATANLGVYGSGQAYEALLVRLAAHPLPEARSYAAMMLAELRKVIPSWVKRVDIADRGGEWSSYLETTRSGMQELADSWFDQVPTASVVAASGPEVTLVDWDPDAEVKLVAAMLYPYTHRSEAEVAEVVAAMSEAERVEVVARYVGERRNRRHRPGRALERCGYRFEVISDYGAFRDLQRHRLLSIEWQELSPAHGYSLPDAVVAVGGAGAYREAMERSAALHGALEEGFGPTRAAYAICLAYRIRYSMQFNAREALHLLELRTSPAGHPEYRKVGQEMHRLIAERAGHRAVAALMRFVDHADYDAAALPRLEAERRAEARRAASAGRRVAGGR